MQKSHIQPAAIIHSFIHHFDWMEFVLEKTDQRMGPKWLLRPNFDRGRQTNEKKKLQSLETTTADKAVVGLRGASDRKLFFFVWQFKKKLYWTIAKPTMQ